MPGTEIMRVEMPPALAKLYYVMLPDGTVRRPFNMTDFIWWSIYSGEVAGHYQVANTWVGPVRISTIFMGVDTDPGLSWDWSDPFNPQMPIGYRPLCFETMVFGGDLDGYQARTRDYWVALADHMVAVEKVKGEGVYKCPRCGAISHNPNDAANRYCGRCHQFEGDPVPDLAS
jgi:ribosomal protein S27AE